MNYEQIDQLTNNAAFQGRVRACCTQEAVTFQADTRPDIVALAEEVLRTGGPVLNFVRMVAAFPGLSVGQVPAPGDDGTTVDQASIPDAEILAQVQHHWPTVAGLFWDDDGNLIPQ